MKNALIFAHKYVGFEARKESNVSISRENKKHNLFSIIVIGFNLIMFMFMIIFVDEVDAATEQDAVNWMNAQKNNGHISIANPGGLNSGQCVALVNKYMREVVGVSDTRGKINQAKEMSGKDWVGFTKIWGNNNYKTGDIVVMNPYSGWVGSTGHVAIVYSTNPVRLLEQNYANRKYPCVNDLGQRNAAVCCVLRPCFTSPVRIFILSYNANGGSGYMAATTHTYGVNQALRKNAFTKTGYTFGGWNVRRLDKNTWWYRNSSGQGGWYAKGKQPSGYSLGVYKDQAVVGYTADGNNCDLYAVWNPKKFTLSYNANSGSGYMVSTTHTYGVNQALRKNAFTKTGYTFGGWNVRRLDKNTWWYRNSSGQGGWYAKGKQPSGYSLGVYKDQAVVGYTADGNNCDLYAVWNPVYPEETIQPKSGQTELSTKNTTALKVNLITVKVKKIRIKYAKLKKKNQVIGARHAFTISKAKGKVTFKKIRGNKRIKVNSIGKIKVKKGIKKGRYKIKVKVRASGNKNYKPGTKIVTVPILIK